MQVCPTLSSGNQKCLTLDSCAFLSLIKKFFQLVGHQLVLTQVFRSLIMKLKHTFNAGRKHPQKMFLDFFNYTFNQ